MRSFYKMHGLGNDFIIFDVREKPLSLSAERVKALCDRRRGIGADLLTIIEPSDKYDAKVIFINADGSPSGACGNATRCVADLVMSGSGKNTCILENDAGTLLFCEKAGQLMIRVDMGPARLEWQAVPLSEEADTLNLPLGVKEGLPAPVAVNMGNPHCVFFVDEPEELETDILGPRFEHDPLFPERTNVEFVKVEDNALHQITWERGVGITEACGSGACAVGVAAVRKGLRAQDSNILVRLAGGDLIINWRSSDNHVLMTGPVAYVFEGEVEL